MIGHRAIVAATLIAIGATLAKAEPPSRCPGDWAAQWVTLGTAGGPLPRAERSQPANALVVGGDIYLFDAGDGLVRQMTRAGLDLGQVRAIFVSHNHIDHNADLGVLLMRRWALQHRDRVAVHGPRGTATMLEELAAAQLPTEQAPLVPGPPPPGVTATFEARDIPAETHSATLIYEDANIAVWAATNSHFDAMAESAGGSEPLSYAFRIEAAGRTIVFTGDTGVFPGLAAFARGADLLVSEVIDLQGVRSTLATVPTLSDDQRNALMRSFERTHLSPSEIGTLAHQANVSCVVLTHLAPGRDGEADLSVYRDGVEIVFEGPVLVANDLDRF